MEPLNCVAWLHDGMLETWTAHQIQTIDHGAAARAAGLPQDKVVLHTLTAGGSFGRRASFTADYVVEAVNVGQGDRRPRPVRVQRTREDDSARPVTPAHGPGRADCRNGRSRSAITHRRHPC